MRLAKFMEDDDHIVWVNPAHVTQVYVDDDYTIVVMQGGREIQLTDALQDVVDALQGGSISG